MPLVLPPTVLGFYLLLLFGPQNPVGSVAYADGTTLAFSFSGLVVASVIYSLPFVVQPLQQAFMQIGRGPLDGAATLGAEPSDAFFRSPRRSSAGLHYRDRAGFRPYRRRIRRGADGRGNIPGETRPIPSPSMSWSRAELPRGAYSLLGSHHVLLSRASGRVPVNRGLPLASPRP